MQGMLTVPIPDNTFVDVEVRLPSGSELASHKSSGVKLDFEMVGADSKHFRVRVTNETNV